MDSALVRPAGRGTLRRRALSGELVSPEIKQLLDELVGYKLAVVTSSSKLEIGAILKSEKILDRFDVAVYGDDVTNLKPHPEPYLLALERLGVTKALVLEDSEPGMRSGRAAGCEVLAVKHPSEVAGMVRARLAS